MSAPTVTAAANDGLISVGIPTRNRPDYLRAAIDSVLSQDYRPLEILVGDDSTGNETAELVDEIERQGHPDVQIQYDRNTPPLGQAGNINALFDAATGRRFILLHDDDLLLPGAVKTLAAAMDAEANVVAAYGRQRLCNDAGDDLGDEAADGLNRRYHRTSADYGPQRQPLAAGILRQFPNNGYLVDTRLAREVRYRTDVGNGCESDFGVRFAQVSPAGGFVLVPQFTCVYRKTSASMSAGGTDSAARFYDALAAMKLPRDVEWARRQTLTQLAPPSLRYHALRGNRRRAFQLWFSRSHRRRFTPRGLYALLRIAFPHLTRPRPPRRKTAPAS